MPETTFIQDFIWYTNSPLLVICAIGLHRRRRVSDFPFFSTYLLFVATTSHLTLVISKMWGLHSISYFYSWLGMNIVSIGLSFVVLYEVVQNVLTSGTLKISRSTFALLAAIFLLAGALLSILQKIDNPSRLMKAIFVGQNVARFDQMSLLVLLAVLTLFFGLFWGDLAFGIAAGFGVYATMELLRVYLFTHLGSGSSHLTNLLSQWSYQIASLIWLFYIWKKPKSPLKSLPSDKVSEYTEPIVRLIKK